MFKKTITYTDYNDVERTEDFYFNLTRMELTEMSFAGMVDKLQNAIDTQDATAMVSIFKDLIFKSYGEKSEDGKRFVKSEELSTAFSQTEAYSTFVVELMTEADMSTKFVEGLFSADVLKQIRVAQEAQPKMITDTSRG
ncbi:MAG: hypothetical protein R3Y53_02035 [Bacillota bacterium]